MRHTTEVKDAIFKMANELNAKDPGPVWIIIMDLLTEIWELEREVLYLRHYGNKDCTAQADEAIANGEIENE